MAAPNPADFGGVSVGPDPAQFGATPVSPTAPSGAPVVSTQGLPKGPQEKPILERAAPYYLGPAGPARLASEGLQALDRGAYKAGGAVTDAASKVLPPEAAAALGVGTNLAIGSLPMLAGGGIGTKAAPLMERGAKSLMTSALKPDKFARESGEGARAIETLLEKGFNVTEGGVEKMTAEIDKLDDALTQAIKTSKANVSTIASIKPVKDAIEKFRYGLNQATDKSAIRAEVMKFLDHPEVQMAMNIPIQTAQKIKQAIYRELGDKAYGFGIKPEAEAAGKKAIASGLKTEIEKGAPATAGINKEMGDLINARDLAQQRVGVAANRDPLGLGSLVDPRKWLLWLTQRNEAAKSLAARGMHAGQEAIPRTAGQLAGAGVGAEMERR